MNIQIKCRFTAKVLFEADVPTIKAALELGIKSRANLSGADLSRADLCGADLYCADLSGADLSRADLSGADLYCADLSGADLSRADLSGADLYCANLYGANLYCANLSGADLYCANLYCANLYGADLYCAKNADMAIAQTRILPEGDLIGWKKCQDGVMVKVKVPADAKRSHAFGRKCRAEFVDVLEVIGADHGISRHDAKTKYVSGERVACDQWCDDFQQECAGGIHFFITKLEAENY